MAGPSSHSDTTAEVVDDADAEVVILSDAADLDPATHAKFFSDGDAAGVELSWPEAEAIVSKLSEDEISALCRRYRVPDNAYRPVCAGLLRRASTTPAAGSGAVCVYAAALDAGMRFPLHGFYVKLLRHYRLAPSQLTPTSWAYLAAFVRLCEDAGVEPLVSVFRHFFTITSSVHNSKKGALSPSGWHHFQPFPEGRSNDPHRWRCRRLFTGGNLPSHWSGWKSYFFFLEAAATTPAKSWKCPVKWGKPRRADVRPPKDAADAAIRKLREQAGEKGVDLTGFLSQRRAFPVGPHDSDLILVAAAGASTGNNKRKSPQHGAASRPTPLGFTAFYGFPPILRRGSRTQPTLPGFSPTAPGSHSGTFVGAQGSYSQRSALQFWNTIAAGESDKTGQLQDALRAANGEVAKLRRELQEHAAGYALHMTAVVAQLNQEHAAHIARLNEDHAVVVKQLKDTAAKELRDAELKVKKEAVLAILPSLEHMPLKFAKLD